MRSAEEIRAVIAGLVAEWSDLEAQFGAAGVGGLTMFDVRRKAELAKHAAAYRSGVLENGGRVTDGAVDDAAHAHPDYAKMVDTALERRRQYARLSIHMELLRSELRVAEVREIAALTEGVHHG